MRTYEQAKAYAVAQHKNPTRDWTMLCQMFSRQCVGAEVFGGSARVAYGNIPPSHRFSSTPPPPGSLAYFGRASENSGAGHVVFMVEGGYCWSNDILREGKIDKVHYTDITEAWGRTNYSFRGWIDWTPSGKIDVRLSTPGGGGGGTGVGGKVRKVDASLVRTAWKNDRKGHRTEGARDDILLVEKALADLGFMPRGAVNGLVGPQSRPAYARWEKSIGIKPDGYPGLPGLTRLGKHSRVKVKFNAVP